MDQIELLYIATFLFLAMIISNFIVDMLSTKNWVRKIIFSFLVLIILVEVAVVLSIILGLI